MQKILAMSFPKRALNERSTPYKYFRPKRLGFVARLCWWLLKKLGALQPYSEKYEVWTYTPDKKRALTEYVACALNGYLDFFRSPDDFVLIVGAVDFAEIMNEYDFQQRHITLNTGSLYYGIDGYTYTIKGIPVHIVGHMRGLTILQKAIIEEKRRAV